MKPTSSESAAAQRLPRFLFWLDLALAAGLLAALVGSPYIALSQAQGALAGRLLALFAHDPAVRQTALAAAIGLVVTAWVFFRAPAPVRSVSGPRTARTPVAPPANIVGA